MDHDKIRREFNLLRRATSDYVEGFLEFTSYPLHKVGRHIVAIRDAGHEAHTQHIRERRNAAREEATREAEEDDPVVG